MVMAPSPAIVLIGPFKCWASNIRLQCRLPIRTVTLCFHSSSWSYLSVLLCPPHHSARALPDSSSSKQPNTRSRYLQKTRKIQTIQLAPNSSRLSTKKKRHQAKERKPPERNNQMAKTTYKKKKHKKTIVPPCNNVQHNGFLYPRKKNVSQKIHPWHRRSRPSHTTEYSDFSQYT